MNRVKEITWEWRENGMCRGDKEREGKAWKGRVGTESARQGNARSAHHTLRSRA